MYLSCFCCSSFHVHIILFCRVDALYFVSVRCTYWSLGESFKPGGCVNNFVVAASCYHPFCHPDGHPDISKRRYFFSNISVSFSMHVSYFFECYFLCMLLISDYLKENLLKNHDEVSMDVMTKAFNHSAKARPLYRSDLVGCLECFLHFHALLYLFFFFANLFFWTAVFPNYL